MHFPVLNLKQAVGRFKSQTIYRQNIYISKQSNLIKVLQFSISNKFKEFKEYNVWAVESKT